MKKIKIFSVHASRTDFLEYQVESLRYFCEDEFDYYCIDNFSNKSQSNFIKEQCNNLNVNYLKFNYPINGNSSDHATALNSIKQISNNEDINVILDFDIFLISNFSFKNKIKDYDIVGVYQQRNNFSIEYLAPFVVIVNENSNFSQLDFSLCQFCDVGGSTQHFIKSKKVGFLEHTSSLEFPGDENCFNIEYDIQYGSQVIESSFLHYYRGTNWNKANQELVNKKTEWLKECLTKSKNGSILNNNYLKKYQTVYSHSFCFWNGTNNKFNSRLNPYIN